MEGRHETMKSMKPIITNTMSKLDKNRLALSLC